MSATIHYLHTRRTFDPFVKRYRKVMVGGRLRPADLWVSDEDTSAEDFELPCAF